MSASTNKRALAIPSNNNGRLRHDTYKELIDRMKLAISNGFFLEAIALQESIIADRLESRLNFLSNSDRFSFKPLGTLIGAIAIEPDSSLKNLVSTDVESWREKRNAALHRMAKIDNADPITWQDKLNLIKTIADEGTILFRKVIQAVERLK